jgi:hypothetical protein
MASYLKFDGVNDNVKLTAAPKWTSYPSEGSVVVTMFVRFHHIPTGFAPIFRFTPSDANGEEIYFGVWLHRNDMDQAGATYQAEARASAENFSGKDTHSRPGCR